jgi:hypothetical protein
VDTVQLCYQNVAVVIKLSWKMWLGYAVYLENTRNAYKIFEFETGVVGKIILKWIVRSHEGVDLMCLSSVGF